MAHGNISGWIKQADAWIAVALFTLLVLLLMPLPTQLLDILLAFNLAISVAVFLSVFSLKDPLELSSFPSLLLFTALFRTALSIAVMRSILTRGHAGSLVEGVGQFVLGDNFLVGAVLFLTLIIVQFAVISSGANRIAEVAARFTLDALPGKQMSIDADLSSGLITEDEARRRRKRLEHEADFYGSMDGAAKFMRGDAIASLIVAALCFVGGLCVGIWQRGESVNEALRAYALLTVGQGLLIQIPALLLSSASGLIVTRSASEENLSKALLQEAHSQPGAFMFAALIALLIGLIPGMPKIPFLVLGVLLLLAPPMLRRSEVKRKSAPEHKPTPPEDFTSLIQVDPIEIELGLALIPLVSGEGKLLQRITNLRRRIAEEMGLTVPPIRVRDNIALPQNRYVIKVRGAKVAEGEVYPGKLLAVGGANLQPLNGIQVREAAFGLPAFWIEQHERRNAESLGYMVVDCETAMITHLHEVIKEHAPEILSRQQVQMLIEHVQASHPAVVEELIPQLLSRGEIHQVLRNLLSEGVPIRDIVAILEELSDGARISKDLDFLTGRVRQRLARIICQQHVGHDGTIAAIAFDPQLEEELLSDVKESDGGRVLVPDPEKWQEIIHQIASAAERIATLGYQPVVVCSRSLRSPLRRLLSKFVRRVPVLCYDEINAASASLKIHEFIKLQNERMQVSGMPTKG